MNLRIGIILIGLLFLSCEKNESSLQNDEETGNCATGTSTATILVNIDEEIYNNDESVLAYSKYSWSSDGTNRILNGNGIPNHEVGTFPNSNNPNSISEQNVSKSFTLCTSIINESGLEVVGPAMAIAYALNSVKFDPAIAGRCNDAGECSLARGDGNWNIEALGHETFDFGDDMNHAHVQPNGAYHYHGMPELLIDFLGDSNGMTLIGWASDGFTVYARYG
ncbi:MAG: YHYH protein [Bacteroidetes bacterium]|nr:YHYH protein [Bacteroidota bacterium]